jgi:pimeloyl-ACP methyl ester carboxylesterase
LTATTLVLLPGLDGTEIFFRPLLTVLPDWIKPVVVKYPTSGTNGYSDLLEVVEAAIVDLRRFYVLGWSFSGPLALTIAGKHPTRIRGVILCASFVRPPLRALSWLKFVTAAPVVYLLRVARRTPLFLVGDSAHSLRRDKRATWNRVPSMILAARARAILTLDARECLRACPCPVLYLAGSRDRVVPSRNAREVIRESPSTKVVTIDGPHLALYTNPGAAAHAIAAFMRNLEMA